MWIELVVMNFVTGIIGSRGLVMNCKGLEEALAYFLLFLKRDLWNPARLGLGTLGFFLGLLLLHGGNIRRSIFGFLIYIFLLHLCKC